ncbi:energy transducer TonB [Rhodobacteraceae bacterium 63075]|nr:energy transducer TonB [Rhodobacteraceae bacterium 63075]
MNTGQIISLVGHTGLIGWLLFGGAWNSEPLPFEISEVAVVSEAEYQAALRATEAPRAVSDIETPAPPTEDESAAPGAQPDTPTETQEPPDVAQPEADASPEIDSSAPEVETEVEDTAPQIVQPEEDIAALTPGASTRPQLKPVERIAPEPVAQPEEPDAAPAEQETPETIPDEEAEAPVEQEESEATSPQEATIEIDPEASDDVTLAPAQSTRPRPRPARPDPEQTDETPDTSDAVNDALAEALGGDEPEAEPAAPTGPPLTGDEREGLRLAVSRCWNLGALSTDAMAVTIVVGLDMTREAKPVIGSINLISSEGGSDAAARQAYEAARRAIIRCGSGGYDLPAEKYDRWKTIEMKFNPESMR